MSAAAVASHCPYCALQCGVTITSCHTGLSLSGNAAFPVTRGALCIKGWSALEPLAHPERLRTPLVRGDSGQLEPASWNDALDTVAQRFSHIQTRYGADAVGVFGGGAL